jgi:hypothetical protein
MILYRKKMSKIFGLKDLVKSNKIVLCSKDTSEFSTVVHYLNFDMYNSRFEFVYGFGQTMYFRIHGNFTLDDHKFVLYYKYHYDLNDEKIYVNDIVEVNYIIDQETNSVTLDKSVVVLDPLLNKKWSMVYYLLSERNSASDYGLLYY